jgi:hypothetical protein
MSKDIFSPDLTAQEKLEVFRMILKWLTSHANIDDCPYEMKNAMDESVGCKRGCPYDDGTGFYCVQLQMRNAASEAMRKTPVMTFVDERNNHD